MTLVAQNVSAQWYEIRPGEKANVNWGFVVSAETTPEPPIYCKAVSFPAKRSDTSGIQFETRN